MNDKALKMNEVIPYNPRDVETVEDALMLLKGCSMQGRNLGLALDVLTKMYTEKNCLRILTLAGAMVPAGMEEIINQMIERGIVQVIVSTGANIIHSIINELGNCYGQAHYIGSEHINDVQLAKLRINRVFDTLIPEEHYETAEHVLLKILKERFKEDDMYILKPSEIFEIIGNKLENRSFINTALRNNIPIFCGATSDSELGLDLSKFRSLNDLNIVLDEVGDVYKFVKILDQYEKHGAIILGGGVPRNLMQMIFNHKGFLNGLSEAGSSAGFLDFSIQFYSSTMHILNNRTRGGHRNANVVSKKEDQDTNHVEIWGDSTVYLPLLITAFFQRLERLKLEKIIQTDKPETIKSLHDIKH
ncbi:MAG: deoxyhypusine synthase family protein [Promethearchaeota archaeon]